MKNLTIQTFEPSCLATTIGSLPHIDVAYGTKLMFESTPEIPSWIQFPKRTFHENMIMQFTEGMPALVKDEERIYFSTLAANYIEQVTDFYDRYLAATEDGNPEAADSFGLSAQYAAGFFEFTAQLPERVALGTPLMLKGQVIGPFTLGTNLLDQDGRCSYYDEQLHDVIIKTISMKAV